MIGRRLQGEIEDTLAYLRTQGTRLVLGLREVMDSPALLAAEWDRKNMIPRIREHFDDVWVYGPRGFYDPLEGIAVPEDLRERMTYVGFLKRNAYGLAPRPVKEPYILVTPGGGGDGAEMIRSVIEAYCHHPDLPSRAVIVTGPYMPSEQRHELQERARQNPKLEMMDFSPRMEDLMADAKAVICMSGYNTWCEVLSFDKPTLLVPRTEPREEQLIRALRATELHAATMLMPDEARDPDLAAQKIRALETQLPPSVGYPHPDLDGLDNIIRIVGDWLDPKRVAGPLAV